MNSQAVSWQSLQLTLQRTKHYLPASFYLLVLATFITNHWQAGHTPSIVTAHVIALAVALPLTVLVWLSGLRKLPLLVLLLLHNLFVIVCSVLLTQILQIQNGFTTGTMVFYLLLAASGLAGIVASIIDRWLPKIWPAFFYRGKRAIFIGIFLILFVAGYPYAVRHAHVVQSKAQAPTDIAIASHPEFSKQTFYQQINAARNAKGLSELTRQPSLEQAAQDYLDQTYVTHTLDVNATNETEKKSIISHDGYQYYAIADVLATISSTNDEATVIAHWQINTDIAGAMLDPSFDDIGAAFMPISNNTSEQYVYVLFGTTKKPTPVAKSQPAQPGSGTSSQGGQSASFTGVDLFAAVNASRTTHGVNPLQQSNPLCTVASIRLNEQLDLGKLDNHAGFDAVLATYKDQLSQYSHVSENLASGYPTAPATVTAWEGSPGHLVLLKDGSYVWGCTAANHGFAVLIAAF